MVFDRAYFCYDFINILDEHELNYVIRVKNNCTYINNKNIINTKINNENVRFITHISKKNINITEKNNNVVELEETITCNLVTNLPIIKYNDESIKNIYLMRWVTNFVGNMALL